MEYSWKNTSIDAREIGGDQLSYQNNLFVELLATGEYVSSLSKLFIVIYSLNL